MWCQNNYHMSDYQTMSRIFAFTNIPKKKCKIEMM